VLPDQTSEVCHYTTAEAFGQIVSLQGLTIEASHIASFEDTSEGNLVANEVVNRFLQLLSQIPESIPLDLSAAWTQLETYRESLSIAQIQREAYVLSLSSAIDSLPMWRLYGSNGTGVCLVFDTVVLNGLVAQWGAQLRPIDYHRYYEQDLRSSITAIMQNGVPYSFLSGAPFHDASRNTIEHLIGWMQMNIDNIQNRVNHHSLYVKSKAFEFEQEVRAVFQPPKKDGLEIVFRGGSRVPVARLRLPISVEAARPLLKRVILAPGLGALSSTSKLRMGALYSTFKSKFEVLKDVAFEQSAIPFYSSYGR
jgi:Protein of unknown function (DUF2971)